MKETLLMFWNSCLQVCIFADETAIYLALENKGDSDKLQSDLDRLQTW